MLWDGPTATGKGNDQRVRGDTAAASSKGRHCSPKNPSSSNEHRGHRELGQEPLGSEHSDDMSMTHGRREGVRVQSESGMSFLSID